VNTSNVRAQKLYEEFDFKNLKLLVGYYPNGDDAYQMEMPFAAAAQAL
jgi:ribosomal protein S18 acetylase RimI-like enzyme